MQRAFEVLAVPAPEVGKRKQGFVHAAIGPQVQVPYQFFQVLCKGPFRIPGCKKHRMLHIRDQFHGHDDVAQDFGDVSEGCDLHELCMDLHVFAQVVKYTEGYENGQ